MARSENVEEIPWGINADIVDEDVAARLGSASISALRLRVDAVFRTQCGARLAGTGLHSRPRPRHALHLAHPCASRSRYIIPMGPISSSSAVFFCSSRSAA